MQIGVLIGVNLIIGFSVGGIDNAAHIGGLLAGCWLGLTMVPRGAATLASYWTTDAVTSGASAARGRSPVSARTAGIVGLGALTVAICAGLAIGPLRWGL
jgi:hypothetical protein